ncbi:hypothetical protein T07_10501 [Trichinella nelsoni]|uniref:SCP domain-containing protein n=1 Tax=Trichinella nelsoni TaxID=6336 RepID=A0A0V0RS23_9BILA|nr:hypothetical protein T07_10501 [Trichinella nelsoni]
MKLLCVLILSFSCIYIVSTNSWYGNRPEPTNLQAYYPIYKQGLRSFKLLKTEAEFNRLMATNQYFTLSDRILVAKEKHDPNCRYLSPIHELYYAEYDKYMYMLKEDDVESYILYGWKDNGIIGYGVVGKSDCQANLVVTHHYHEDRFNDSSFIFQSVHYPHFRNYYDLGTLFACWK